METSRKVAYPMTNLRDRSRSGLASQKEDFQQKPRDGGQGNFKRTKETQKL